MLVPCEVAVKTVSPAIRALLAKTLMQQYQMKETQVAQTLGITQSAVSKYSKNVRGSTIPIENIPEIQTILAKITGLLLMQPKQSSDQMAMMKLFCEACDAIRSNGAMCALCKQNMKSPIEQCTFCHHDSCGVRSR
jgi:predicted transcriptional regulator